MSRFSVPLGGALLLLGCTNSDVATTAPIPATAVAIDPTRFLDGVSCVDAPGAMRVYVATLTDVSPLTVVAPSADGGNTQIVLPSSAPTPCYEEVVFERIVVGREYVADIQGYDRADIEPLGCPKNANDVTNCAGSPVMVTRATGDYVAPRWTTSCGRHPVVEDAGPIAPPPPGFDAGFRYLACSAPPYRDGGKPQLDGPVCAETEDTVVVGGCAPLVAASSSPTGVTVDLTDALGGQSCQISGVSVFSANIEGAGASTANAACGASAEFDGLTPGQGYTFAVTAASGDAGPRLGTTCFATAVIGAVVRAACDPFVALNAD